MYPNKHLGFFWQNIFFLRKILLITVLLLNTDDHWRHARPQGHGVDWFHRPLYPSPICPWDGAARVRTQRQRGCAPDFAGTVVEVDSELATGAEEEGNTSPPDVAVGPGALAYVLYTSPSGPPGTLP